MTAEQVLFHGDSVEASRVIYTPSSFAKSSLLHIQEIGILQATKQHKSNHKNLNSFLFFIVHSGTGELFYDGVTYTIHSGECVFIDCRKPYYHSTSKDFWKLSWIHFDGPTVNAIYEKYVSRGGYPVFRPKNKELYFDAFKSLHRSVISDSYVRDMIINQGLSELLVLLMTDSWHPENMQTPKLSTLSALKNYLDENYNKKISLDELSERYYINKYYLTRIFKAKYGMSINNYITSVRITHAKQELRFTSKTAEEIAVDTGFGTGHYFSRVFSKIEGISPSEYREQWG